MVVIQSQFIPHYVTNAVPCNMVYSKGREKDSRSNLSLAHLVSRSL